MKFCFTPGILFASPPLTKRMQGRIFYRIGKYAEDHIADDYQAFTGRKDWYPKPIDAPDFRDGSQQLSAKTIYFSFLVEKNPNVDKAKLELLMNQRAIQGSDGQLLYIPDFMSEKAPAAKAFYEVKPGLAHHENSEGETKVASVRALVQDVGLSYIPGTAFKPKKSHVLFRHIILVPGMGIFPLPVTVTFEYQRHDQVDGLVVYHFCIDANFKAALAMSLIIGIAALIILAILFPDLLDDIPTPTLPLPIPRPELPPAPPQPSPVPPAPRPQPVPVPAPPFLQQLRNLLSSIPSQGAGADVRSRALRRVGRRGWQERARRRPTGAVPVERLAGNRGAGLSQHRRDLRSADAGSDHGRSTGCRPASGGRQGGPGRTNARSAGQARRGRAGHGRAADAAPDTGDAQSLSADDGRKFPLGVLVGAGGRQAAGLRNAGQ